MTIEYATISETGLRAVENQDSVLGITEDQSGLFAVADGMGGHADGTYASNAVIEALARWWNKYTGSAVGNNGYFQNVEQIKQVLKDTNDRIRESSGCGVICGSTVVAFLIEGNCCSIFSCGDSRCYFLRRKKFAYEFSTLTTDDVWENDPALTKGLSSEEIIENRQYGKLLRAVGTETKFGCTVMTDEVSRNSVYLLCSDGVYKYIPEDEIMKMMRKAAKGADLSECAEILKRKVFENGAPDNLSVIFIRIK